MLAVVCLILAQAAGSAWSSGRPPECSDPIGRAGNVWERAKSPELHRYCDLVAGAAAKLAGEASMASVALASAAQADGLLPGHAAPLLLEGRASLALDRLDDALRALEEARRRDARAFDDPLALLAYCRALARGKRTAEAAAAYGTLLPRTSALPAAERVAAALEAGLVTMAGGPEAVDAAKAAFREALRGGQDELQQLAVFALALALDRGGEEAQARALLDDRGQGDAGALLASSRVRAALRAGAAEADALSAFALEASDPGAARALWQKYVEESPTGPFAQHARGRLAALARRTLPAPKGRR
jgi:hypothetical protein